MRLRIQNYNELGIERIDYPEEQKTIDHSADAKNLSLLQKGEDYSKRNKSYVIFICTEDIFGKGRHIYTFENLCIQELELCLNDETKKVFWNPISDMDDVDEELKNFLLYVASDKPVDDFTRELEHEVEDARKNKGWEAEYMTLHMIEREKYNEGIRMEKPVCWLRQ